MEAFQEFRKTDTDIEEDYISNITLKTVSSLTCSLSYLNVVSLPKHGVCVCVCVCVCEEAAVCPLSSSITDGKMSLSAKTKINLSV